MSEPPAEPGSPPLGGWPRLYALVIVELAIVIALLAWLTARYA